jgi:hypothetical protein
VCEAEWDTVLETVAVTTPHRDAATLITPAVVAVFATANDAIELLYSAGNALAPLEKLRFTHDTLTTTSLLRNAMPLCTTAAESCEYRV